jgi:membrane protein implicated in regulation of membrane protease activity
MEYFLENPERLWYLIAGISFVVELSLMGLSGPLLFFAIASLATGVLVDLNFIEGWQSEVLVVGLFTAIIAAILWKPLKKLQNTKSATDTSSDMIGLKIYASSNITATGGTIRYSGIDWQARLADDTITEFISDKSQCQIVAIMGNTMLVKAL